MSTRREFLTRAAVVSFLAGTDAGAGVAEENTASAAATGTPKPAGPLKTYTVPHTDLVVTRLCYGNAMIGMDSSSADFIAQTVTVMRASSPHRDAAALQ